MQAPGALGSVGQMAAGGLAKVLISPMERLLSTVGLNQPWQRMLAFGAAGYIFAETMKPSFAYFGEQKRPWAMTDSYDKRDGVPPTPIPWFTLPILAGWVGSTLL